MTNHPRPAPVPAVRSRTLTAWQLLQMLPLHHSNLGIKPIEVLAWIDDDDRTKGLTTVKVGWDFAHASVTIMCGPRQVWGIASIRGTKDYWLYYGKYHPLCEASRVGAGCELEVREG